MLTARAIWGKRKYVTKSYHLLSSMLSTEFRLSCTQFLFSCWFTSFVVRCSHSLCAEQIRSTKTETIPKCNGAKRISNHYQVYNICFVLFTPCPMLSNLFVVVSRNVPVDLDWFFSVLIRHNVIFVCGFSISLFPACKQSICARFVLIACLAHCFGCCCLL